MSDYTAEDRGPSVRRLCIAMIIIPVVAVLLRFWSRAVTIKSKSSNSITFWWDDWLALANLPFTLAQCGITLYWVTIGLGKHSDQVPVEDQIKGLQVLYAGYFLYNAGISVAKFSALAFYTRVFVRNNAHNQKFILSIKIAFGFSIVWLFVFLFVDIFQCTPIKKAWDTTIPGHCVNTYSWWLGYAISSVIIDVAILLLPLPMLWGLQLKARRKALITALFACGYCVVLISIGRMTAIRIIGNRLDEDLDYEVVPILYWLTVEAPISIVSICLPSIFSLIKRGIHYGPYSLLSSKDITDIYPGKLPRWAGTKTKTHITKARGSTFQTENFTNSFERLNDVPDPRNVDAFAMACRGSSNNSIQDEENDQSIKVKRDVDISHVMAMKA